MTSKNSKGKRKPEWDLDKIDGEAGQYFVAQMLRKDNIEVKHDMKAPSTGQLYIEEECLFETGWGPSGLTTCKAEAWFFVLDLPNMITLSVKTSHLRELVEYYRDSRPLSMMDGKNPTRGTGVPINALVRE